MSQCTDSHGFAGFRTCSLSMLQKRRKDRETKGEAPGFGRGAVLHSDYVLEKWGSITGVFATMRTKASV